MNERLKEIRDFLGDDNEERTEGTNITNHGRTGNTTSGVVHDRRSAGDMKQQIRSVIESGDPTRMLEMLEWIYATQVVLPATFQPAHAAHNLYEASR